MSADEGSCPNKGKWLTDELLKTIDTFAADYEKAKRELHVTPTIVAPETRRHGLRQAALPEAGLDAPGLADGALTS